MRLEDNKAFAIFRIGIHGRECSEKGFEFVFDEISFNYFNNIFRAIASWVVMVLTNKDRRTSLIISAGISHVRLSLARY